MAYENKNTPLIQELLDKQLNQALQISDLTNKVNDLQYGVHRILYILENDEGTGSDGLVKAVRDIKSTVDSHEHFKRNLEGKLWGLAVIGGFISSFIVGVISKIVNKL